MRADVAAFMKQTGISIAVVTDSFWKKDVLC
jgi:hypothetical protein